MGRDVDETDLNVYYKLLVNSAAIDGNVLATALLIGHLGIIILGGLYVVGENEWFPLVWKKSDSFQLFQASQKLTS